MGSVASAKCQCGFDEKFSLGAGMLDFRTSCRFPAYCTDCKALYRGDLYSEEDCCPNCQSKNYVAYDNSRFREHAEDPLPSYYEKQTLIDRLLRRAPKLVRPKRNTDQDIFSWSTFSTLGRDVYLTNENYFCPKCEKFSLKFEAIALFD